MIDLAATTYLHIGLDEAGWLHFAAGTEYSAPALRRAADMADVLREPAAAMPEDVLYRMYRDVRRAGDGPRIEAAGLRFDLTVLRPGSVGREAVKTYGHYHPARSGGGGTYPEIYEVIHGAAQYLLQKPGEAWDTIADVVLVAAAAGDKVIIPPGYGHVTVNPGDDYLVMANLVARGFASDYAPYRQLRGAAWYVLADGTTVPNGQYSAVAPLRRAAAGEMPLLGVPRDVPLYRVLPECPESLAFLV
jgi:glucose-6-phosphate isomerase